MKMRRNSLRLRRLKKKALGGKKSWKKLRLKLRKNLKKLKKNLLPSLQSLRLKLRSNLRRPMKDCLKSWQKPKLKLLRSLKNWNPLQSRSLMSLKQPSNNLSWIWRKQTLLRTRSNRSRWL